MELSDVLILAVGLLAIALTWLLWVRVTRRVRTEEHPVVHLPRTNRDPARPAYPA